MGARSSRLPLPLLNRKPVSNQGPQELLESPPHTQLCDVLLDVRVCVFEPLWTVIPSSKAILPILCKIRPGAGGVAGKLQWEACLGSWLTRKVDKQGHSGAAYGRGGA